MINKKTTFLFLFLFVLMSNGLKSEEVSRHILALYDSDRGQTTKKNHIHANAEVILNHLGCIVDYWDIKNGLPDEQIMQKYFGVITWFYSNAISRPEEYLSWALRQVDANRKFVILGNVGAFKNARTGKFLKIDKLNVFCRRLGFIIDDSNWTDDITKIELVYKDPEMVEFERSLDYEISNYEKYHSTNPENKIYLKLKRNDLPDLDSQSDMVFTTPQGGFAATSYVLFENKDTYHKKWRINPFKFFEEAFGLKDSPRPDVTTLNGMRIWCSHIDGDALISKSEVKPNSYCSEIIRDEIIYKYKWPVSVSIVVGEVIRAPKFAEIARSIFQPDWVEAASHSHAHPYYWADDYEDKEKKYTSRHLPIAGYTFDVRTEIIGSVDYITKTLLPAGKKVKHFFWTGNCEPTPEAIKLCEEINLNNINGGDTVFDKKNPSYTSVASLGADVGGYRQIYAPNANENIYTNEWKGPYYGFKFVLETFKNTESPIRIKPINIYYHYYSGEKWAALNALKKVVEETITREVAPLFISEYTDIVHGFYNTKIEKLAKSKWKIKDLGKCRTIRFDETDRSPDFKQSSNILGFTHYQGSLYVHLGSLDQAIVALTDSKPERTYLKKSSHRIKHWSATKTEISFNTDGFGKGEFVIANLSKNRNYEVTIKNKMTNNYTIKSDINGILRFLQPMEGPLAVRIKRTE